MTSWWRLRTFATEGRPGWNLIARHSRSLVFFFKHQAQYLQTSPSHGGHGHPSVLSHLLLPANLRQSSLLLTNQQQGRTKDARKGRKGTKEWGEGGRRKMPKPILLEEVQDVHLASLFVAEPNLASNNDHIYSTFLT